MFVQIMKKYWFITSSFIFITHFLSHFIPQFVHWYITCLNNPYDIGTLWDAHTGVSHHRLQHINWGKATTSWGTTFRVVSSTASMLLVGALAPIYFVIISLVLYVYVIYILYIWVKIKYSYYIWFSFPEAMQLFLKG